MGPTGHFRQKLPDLPLTSLAMITLFVLGIVGLFVLVMRNPQVLLILFAGLFLGIAIKPAVEWMARHGLPQELGAVLIFIAVLVLLGIFIGFVLPLLVAQTVNLTAALSDGYFQFRMNLLSMPNLVLYQIGELLPADVRLLQPDSLLPGGGEGEGGLGGVDSALRGIVGGGLALVLVLFLAINWSVEGDRFLRTVLLLSSRRREFLRAQFQHIEQRVSRYLTGLGLLSLIVGVISLIGYLLIGLPYAVALAFFAGVMEAVPMVGPAIGAIPAILIALSISPGAAIAVIALTIVIQVAENVWIFPRVMGSSLGLSPFLTLITMFVFSTLFGLAGALIAIPIFAVSTVIFESAMRYMREQDGKAVGRDRLSAVRYEIAELIDDIRSQARDRENESNGHWTDIEDSLETIAIELSALLERPHGEQRR